MRGVVNLTLGIAQEIAQIGHDVFYYSGEKFGKRTNKSEVKHRDMRYPNYPYPIHTYTVCMESIHASYVFVKEKIKEVKNIDPDCVITTFDDITGVIIHKMLDVPIVIVNPFPKTDIFWELFWDTNELNSLGEKWSNKMKSDIPYHYRDLRDLIYDASGVRIPSSLDESHYFKGIKFDEEMKIEMILNSRKFVEPLIDGSMKCDPTFVGYAPRDKVPDSKNIGADVFVSLGTSPEGFNREFLEKVKRALSGTNVQVLYSLGGFNMPVASAPENFRFVSFAPQQSLLSDVSAFVTHGGINSVHELIKDEVPSLATPHSYDQYITSKCLRARNAALVQEIETVKPKEIKFAVERLINSQKTAVPGLEKLRRSFDNEGGRRTAAKAIIRHAS